MTIQTSHFKYKDHDFMTCGKSHDKNHSFMVYQNDFAAPIVENDDVKRILKSQSFVKEVICKKCLMRVKIHDSLYFGSAANEIMPACNDEGPFEDE